MIPSTPPITGDGIFDDTPLETVYVVDVNAKRVYLAQEPWNYYAIVVMPTGIEELETDKTTPTIVGLLRPKWQTHQWQAARCGHPALLRWHNAQGAGEVTARKHEPPHKPA